MEVKMLEEKKNKIIFELDADAQIAAPLAKELWNDSHIKAAGYNIDHPLLGKPKFVVETDGEDPRKAVTAAAKRLNKMAEKMADVASKELK